MTWINSAETFIGARKLRNLPVHEYMVEPELFLEALLAAKPATELLFQIIDAVRREALLQGSNLGVNGIVSLPVRASAARQPGQAPGRERGACTAGRQRA